MYTVASAPAVTRLDFSLFVGTIRQKALAVFMSYRHGGDFSVALGGGGFVVLIVSINMSDHCTTMYTVHSTASISNP